MYNQTKVPLCTALGQLGDTSIVCIWKGMDWTSEETRGPRVSQLLWREGAVVASLAEEVEREVFSENLSACSGIAALQEHLDLWSKLWCRRERKGKKADKGNKRITFPVVHSMISAGRQLSPLGFPTGLRTQPKPQVPCTYLPTLLPASF